MYMICRKKPKCQNQLDPSIRFDRTPTCDKQTHADTGRQPMPRQHNIELVKMLTG